MKRFSGTGDCSLSYPRFKKWCLAYMTFKKMEASERVAFVYTLLGDKALETLDNVKFEEEICAKDGDKLIWAILDARYPVRAVIDELGDALSTCSTS